MPVMVCNHDAGWDVAIDNGMTWETARYLWYAKTPLIPSYVGDTPFIWIDDDHALADQRYLERYLDQPFRFIRTNAHTGLTWDDVNAAVAWAAQHTPTTA
jgi:hypothetical protein